MIDYFTQLNSEQYEVVTSSEGPCLVLAGAGSGKTRTLIYRVAYLLEKKVKPENILLVTFTNKASRHMLDQVENLLRYRPKKLWGGTFHHIGNRCLRKYASRLGYTANFGILDREDSRSLVNSCLQELNIDFGQKRFPRAAVVEAIISLAANSREPLAEIVQSKYPYFEEFIPEIEKVREIYIEHKKASNNMDYDDLLVKWVELLEKVPEALNRYSRQFQYVLVDEYQDTNRLQNEVVRMLSSCHNNILAVGDDAQAIYSFRAADIKNILDFPKNFPGTKIFKLETNYRSTPEILEMANQSMSNNVHQYHKCLKEIRESGHLPRVLHVEDTKEEARFVARRMLELRKEGVPLKEIAVLFRARYQATNLELELVRRNIPYVVRGGVRFFEQAHIKDILAYLRIVVNPRDEFSWRRALLLQPGLGPNFTRRIWSRLAGSSSANPFKKALSRGCKLDLPAKAEAGWSHFLKILSSISQPDILSKPAEAIRKILERGYEQYALSFFENGQDRVEDLEQLANFASSYDSLGKFLTDITLREGFKGETVKDTSNRDPEYTILSTIHQAKGLEWQVVMIIGLSEGGFPHSKSLNDPDELEEERRLFYVAVTRAEEDVYLIHPILRLDYNRGQIITRPSRFVQELPSDCYEECGMTETEELITESAQWESSQW